MHLNMSYFSSSLYEKRHTVLSLKIVANGVCNFFGRFFFYSSRYGLHLIPPSVLVIIKEEKKIDDD